MYSLPEELFVRAVSRLGYLTLHVLSLRHVYTFLDLLFVHIGATSVPRIK